MYSFAIPMIPRAKGSIEIKIHKVIDKGNVYPAENVYETFLQADKLNWLHETWYSLHVTLRYGVQRQMRGKVSLFDSVSTT